MYQLGRLCFTLSGGGPCAAYLHEEMAGIAAATNGHQPHIDFVLADALPPLERYTSVPPLHITATGYRAAHYQLTYDVRGTPDALRVAVQPEPSGWPGRLAPEWALRLLDWNHLAPAENRAKNFLYGIFDHLTHVVQLRLGQSYLHASSIERDGEGIALVAWAGTGKTAAVLKLVAEQGFRYLSDDLALVDDDGVLWRTPKRLQIYGYHVAGQDRLRRLLLAGRTPGDYASWAWRNWRYGPARVRRRVSAEALFGAAAVAQSAPMTRVYFLERGDDRAFGVRRLGAGELGRRATEAVLHEIQPFEALSRAVHGSHTAPVLPTIAAVASQTRAVLGRAFRGVPAWSVRIPLAATPDDLAAYLTKLLSQAATTRPAHRSREDSRRAHRAAGIRLPHPDGDVRPEPGDRTAGARSRRGRLPRAEPSEQPVAG